MEGNEAEAKQPVRDAMSRKSPGNRSRDVHPPRIVYEESEMNEGPAHTGLSIEPLTPSIADDIRVALKFVRACERVFVDEDDGGPRSVWTLHARDAVERLARAIAAGCRT